MSTSKVFLVFVAAVLLTLAACQTDSPTLTQSPGQGPVSLVVEDAGEPFGEKFFTGLNGRESLEGGMLFDFEETVTIGFQMRETLIPLSIAFVSEKGIIIDIQDMEPLAQEAYPPSGPYRYAIEVNQGYFAENGIGVGDRVEVRKAGEGFVMVLFHGG